MTLDLTKPVQTRDGRAARILATDILGTCPVAAAITTFEGDELIYAYTADGRFVSGPDPARSGDLINIPEPEINLTLNPEQAAALMVVLGALSHTDGSIADLTTQVYDRFIVGDINSRVSDVHDTAHIDAVDIFHVPADTPEFQALVKAVTDAYVARKTT